MQSNKKCSRCQKEKLLNCYSKNKQSKDGLQYWCNSCIKEYYRLNKEKQNKKNKKYYQSHKDILLRKMKLHRENNSEKYKEYERRRAIKESVYLHPHYIKNKIYAKTGLRYENITGEIICLQTAITIAKRELKKQKQITA